MDKIKNILNFAMRMEKDAGEFYSYYMDKVQSDSTRELFKELVEIEKQHYNILKSKFDQLGYSEPPISVSWVVDDTFKAKDPHILADNSDITGNADAQVSDLSVIRMAYLIENDFAVFYRNAADAVEDKDAKMFLKELESWEIGHKQMFHNKYQELLKKYWGEIANIIF